MNFITYEEFVNNLFNIKNINCDPLEYVLQNKNILELNKDSLIIEFGVFSGNTINLIANNLKKHTIYGFDSWHGLPEKWDRNDMFFDKGHFSTQGRRPNVSKNVILIDGWFSETLPKFLSKNNKPVKFIHIDCDLYSSTRCIFDNLKFNIKNGCVIVFDELVNYEGYKRNGELKAFYEFVKENNIEFDFLGMNGRMGDIGCRHEKVAVKIKKNPIYIKSI